MIPGPYGMSGGMSGGMGGDVPLDVETLEQMLGMSTIPEERKQILEQLEMAKMLGQSARQYNPNAGKGRGARAAIGGAANAFAQGLEGHMYNKGVGRYNEAEAELRNRERAGRRHYELARRGMLPNAEVATPSPYEDPGQVEETMLPPDEEEGYNPGGGYDY